MKTMTVNNTVLTDETILKTRQWFYDNCMACIKEAEEGLVFVNNLDALREWEMKSADNYITGKNDHILSFLQRAYYIQTGECVPLLAY